MNAVTAATPVEFFGPTVATRIRDWGWGDVSIGPIPSHASARRYFRLRKQEASAMLLSVPKDDDIEAFLAIGSWLQRQGVAAPSVIAKDLTIGLLLLEDLGENTYADLAPGVKKEQAYLDAALLLARLGSGEPRGVPTRGAGRHLPERSSSYLAEELNIFLEFGLCDGRAEGINSDAGRQFLKLWKDALDGLDGAVGFVHADIHGDNLLVSNIGPVSRVGVLDFQDAGLGHQIYDLASLLDDTRCDLPRELRAHLASEYARERARLSAPCHPTEIQDSLVVLGAQRNLRIIGVLKRLGLSGNNSYASGISRAQGHLEEQLRHPRLKQIRAWLEAHS